LTTAEEEEEEEGWREEEVAAACLAWLSLATVRRRRCTHWWEGGREGEREGGREGEFARWLGLKRKEKGGREEGGERLAYLL